MKNNIQPKPVVIKVTGERIEVMPKNGTDFTLEEAQAIVGGYVEVFHIENGERMLIINEEGKLNGLPLNPWATVEFEDDLGVGDFLNGNVLICPPSYFQ